MPRVRFSIFLLLGAALLAQEAPVFRSNVRLVRILAGVKDPSGQAIGTLQKSDFQVFDNGKEQELAVFEHHTEQPLSVAVLMDTSASTGIDIRYEIASVQRFFKALFAEGNSKDAAALYTFNYQVSLQVPYTRNLQRLDGALKGIKNEGGTSLYDAICLASENIDDRDGRHVLVLVTDGGDTTSYYSYQKALESAQRSDVVLYPILVVPIKNDPGRNVGGENALTTLAAGTGGRVFAPTLGDELDRAFGGILSDLRTQYLLGYYPKDAPPSKDRFHRLEVKVPKRPDLRVLARSGYYGDAEDAAGWPSAR